MKHALKSSAAHSHRNEGVTKGVSSETASVSNLFMAVEKGRGNPSSSDLVTTYWEMAHAKSPKTFNGFARWNGA